MTVYTNACIFNPRNRTWTRSSFSVIDGKISELGAVSAGIGEQCIDLGGKRVIPGLIDAHVHIESSLLIPREFGRLILAHGVTTAVCDPHEIANVAGTAGIDFMIQDAKKSPADLFFMVPSCVPATPLELGGASVSAEDLKAYIGNPAVLGLGEMMNVPGVLADDPEVCAKLALFSHIDGHAPGLSGHELQVYAAHGISTDHECTTQEELKQRIALGMYVFLREGDAAKNVAELSRAVTPENAGHCAFCTDDRHVDSLVREGSIDNAVRVAVAAGLPLDIALQMATLSAAEAFGLTDRGVLEAGKLADFCVLEDGSEFRISAVYKNGVPANTEYTGISEKPVDFPPFVLPELSLESLRYPDGNLKAVVANPGSLITDAACVRPTDSGLNKLVCVDRYRGESFGVCPIQGIGIRNGAIAESVMHDAHHIMAAGADDEDLLKAVLAVADAGGGMAVSVHGTVTLLPLPVGGIMSYDRYETVCEGLSRVTGALKETGANSHAFMSLSFMGLTVIPHLKLTPRGLFDGDTFTDTGPFWNYYEKF